MCPVLKKELEQFLEFIIIRFHLLPVNTIAYHVIICFIYEQYEPIFGVPSRTAFLLWVYSLEKRISLVLDRGDTVPKKQCLILRQ